MFRESTIKGWEMMAILIESFPCSTNLEPYIRNYLQESSFNRGDLSRVSVYAAYCLRRYNEKWKQNSIAKIPTKEEIHYIQHDPFSGAIFGGSLDKILLQQKENYPNVRIPRILAIICDCILECGGDKVEGIFRISASSELVFQYKVKLEKGLSTLDHIRDPHVAACLLKTWFYELKHPIIPYELYDLYIQNDGNIQKLSDLTLHSLPEENRFTLLYLIRFLRIIGKPENQVRFCLQAFSFFLLTFLLFRLSLRWVLLIWLGFFRLIFFAVLLWIQWFVYIILPLKPVLWNHFCNILRFLTKFLVSMACAEVALPDYFVQ